MKKVLILKGLPASGKSTFAKEMVLKHPDQYKRVNKDDLRAMLDASFWSKANEKFVLNIRNRIILDALRGGFNVIVDDTNLHPKHEAAIRELVSHMEDVKVEIKEFDTTLEECLKRDAKREKPVGEEVIVEMYNQFLRPKHPKIEYDPILEDAIIVDVDGTLATMKDRSPFDWARVGEDDLNTTVSEVLKAVYRGKKVIIVSGRDGVCEPQTREWLAKFQIPFDALFMRPAGNTEKDSTVKRRIYDENIKDKYNVLFVLDDRDQVVRMWRELGLTCFQVAEGNF